MRSTTHDSIRRIFLSAHPHVSQTTAASLLGCPVRQLQDDIADGTIVAISTGVGVRIPRSEMIAAALRAWPQAAIEEALGDAAPRILPEAIRLTELRAHVPRYQRDMLHYFAQREGRTIDEVLSRELEGLASANSEELAEALPDFAAALSWPDLN